MPPRIWLSSGVLSVVGVCVIDYLYAKNDIDVINYIILAILAVIASPFAIWRMTITHEQKETDRKKQEIERKRHYTDSYIQAVEQLANEKMVIRIGGIYGLEAIMKQDEDHYLNIVELLCDFIRKTSSINEDPKKKGSPKETKEDIQIALNVLGRRQEKMIKKFEEKFRMNLNRAHLPKANLEGLNFRTAILLDAHLDAHFEEENRAGTHLPIASLEGLNFRKANLLYAHLEEANLQHAHLEEANLGGANLKKAYLCEVHLEGAFLRNADLEGAHPWGAYLQRANLSDANLKRASLSDARLEGADLQRANLSDANITDLGKAKNIEGVNLCGVNLSRLASATGLTQEKINQTFGDATTQLLQRFRHPDHWLKTKLDPKREYEEWRKWLADPENYEPPSE